MFKSKFFLAFALAGALIIGGCNENTTDPILKPDAPSAIMAQSVSSTSVKVKWTAPATTFDNFQVKVMDGATQVGTTATVPKATTTYTATGLTEGKVYTFEVMTVNGTEMSSSVTIKWAPASRTTSSIRLYSGLNTTQGSGLNIFGNALPSNKKVAEGALWDLCFDDEGGSFVGSPGVSKYVTELTVGGETKYVFAKATDQEARLISMGRLYTGISSLDDIYETQDLSVLANSTDKFEEKLIDLSSVTDKTKGIGFVIRYKFDDATRYYAKVFVKSTGGKLVQGSLADAYIEVDVSYQKVANVAHAGIRPFEEDVFHSKTSNSNGSKR